MTRPHERGEPMTAGARRAVLVLLVIIVTLSVGNYVYSWVQTGHVAAQARRLDRQAAQRQQTIDALRAQQLAACSFARDLGTAPLPDSPRPGKLGVQLVTDSRAWWRANHCPGTLPVPPGLAKWAKAYGLPGD